MIQIADPDTGRPMAAVPAQPPVDMDREYALSHWRPGWRSGLQYADGIPTGMWFAQCQDPCCDAFRCELLPEPGEPW